MKLINDILNFIGLNGLLAGAVLYVLSYEEAAGISLAVALLSYAQMLFLQVYKIYLLNYLKKKAREKLLYYNQIETN